MHYWILFIHLIFFFGRGGGQAAIFTRLTAIGGRFNATGHRIELIRHRRWPRKWLSSGPQREEELELKREIATKIAKKSALA